jgi:putative phosphoesterase
VENTINILGNTDKKVIKLLQGKSLKKPGKPEKRIMYETTAQALTKENGIFLQNLPKKNSYIVKYDKKNQRTQQTKIGIYHGSPAAHHEFLFDTTSEQRFLELAAMTNADIVVTGHSHTPYYKKIGGIHFINPGSAGRMFDGNPEGSCAVLHLSHKGINVQHYRIPYDIKTLTDKIAQNKLPDIYSTMYRQGRKLN